MNKTESAYQTLRRRLVEGAYAPGQHLVLSSLARELTVSAVPVREALRRLEAEGWVIIHPNVGVEVRAVDVAEWAQAMEALALVEGRATALAAPLLTPDDIARARRENDEMRACMEGMDPLGAGAHSRSFHTILSERCPNGYLQRLIREALERTHAMHRTVSLAAPARTRSAVEEHEQLLRLVETRQDPQVIEQYTRQHKLQTVAAYLAHDGTRPAPVGASLFAPASLLS